jgi:hypothetical protein
MRPITFSFSAPLSGRRTRTGNPQTTLYFRKTGKPRLAQKITPRRPLHAGKVPNGVRLEKPAAPANRSAACRKFFSLLLSSCTELVLWSWRRESNPRPSDYKSDALPTELRQQLGTDAPPRKLIPRIPSRCPGQLYKVTQGKLRRNQRLRETTLTVLSFPPDRISCELDEPSPSL